MARSTEELRPSQSRVDLRSDCLSRHLSEMMERIVRDRAFIGPRSGPTGFALGGLRDAERVMRKPQGDEPATRGKNYITRSGLQRLKDEHRFLPTRERPAMAEVWRGLPATAIAVKTPTISTASGGCGRSMGGFAFSRSESKPRKWWTRKLPRAGQPETRAFFGATVRYANAAGAERVVSIVGTDEVDLNRNHISWVSPLGRALTKSAAGDSVVLQAPGVTEYLTVLDVCYERISVEPFREPPGSEASAKGIPRRR